MKSAAPQLDIDPNRLFAAADAILRASRPSLGQDARISMCVGGQRVGDSLPKNVFTSEELMEAMAMLMRMGLAPSAQADHSGD